MIIGMAEALVQILNLQIALAMAELRALCLNVRGAVPRQHERDLNLKSGLSWQEVGLASNGIPLMGLIRKQNYL